MRQLVAVLLVLIPVGLFAYTSPGSPSGFINDFALILSPDTRFRLEDTLKTFEKQRGAEIAVVTVPTIGTDETIETYAVKLFEEWQIGKSQEDNGVLLLISRDDRQMRIEVGYGLEPVVTDIESGRIISEVLTPAFQTGSYDAGVSAAVDRLMSDISNGAPPVESSPPINFSNASRLIYPVVVIIMLIGSFLGRSKSWWAGGVIGGVAGVLVGLFMGFIYTGLIAIFVLTIFGLALDYIASKAGWGKGGGPRPPWFIGGGGFGGGGGGGGFGGFGGGSSGGGGASGRW